MHKKKSLKKFAVEWYTVFSMILSNFRVFWYLEASMPINCKSEFLNLDSEACFEWNAVNVTQLLPTLATNRGVSKWLQVTCKYQWCKKKKLLAQKQKYRSMEQDRKPRDKPTHIWSPYLWQRRQEYTMEKRQPLQ